MNEIANQIGNTITYFTRTHIVKVSEDMSGNLDIEDDNEAETLDAEAELNLQEVKRFKKLAGIIKS